MTGRSELASKVQWAGDEAYALRAIDRKRMSLERRSGKITGENAVFSGIGSAHRSISGYLWCLDRRREAVESFRLGVWYALWWERLRTMPLGTQVELPLMGMDKTVVLSARSELHSLDPWLGSLVASVMVDDVVLRDLLLACDGFDVEYARPFQVARVEAWRSVVAGTDDFATSLGLAEDELNVAYEDEPLPYGGTWKDTYWVEYRLMRAILAKSQAEFDAAVVAAHDHHVAFYSSVTLDGTPLNGHPRVLLDKGITVLIKVAVQSGLEMRYDAPYFVDWSPWLADAEPIAPEYEPR